MPTFNGEFQPNREYEWLSRRNERWHRRNLARIVAVFVMLASLFFLAVDGLGQAGKNNIDVELSVTSKDATMRTAVESYLARELRSLGDVKVVTDDGSYMLNFLISKSSLLDGRFVGYSLVMVVTFQATCLSAGSKHVPCYVFETFFKFADDTDNLRRLCESAITAFDTQILEPLRSKKSK